MSADFYAGAVIGAKISATELNALTTTEEVRISDEYPDCKFHPQTGEPLTKIVKHRVDLDEIVSKYDTIGIYSDTDCMNSYIGLVAEADYDRDAPVDIGYLEIIEDQVAGVFKELGLPCPQIQLHAVLYCSY